MTHVMTLRLEDDMYEWLRQEAFDRRVPMSVLIRGHLDGVRTIARTALTEGKRS